MLSLSLVGSLITFIFLRMSGVPVVPVIVFVPILY